MPGGRYARDPGINLDTQALSKLTADLRKADRALGRSLKRRVRKAADPVKTAVQQEAAFSTRIPGSIAIRASYATKGAKVRVIADARKAPHARPINNNDRAGFFRHRVFGQDVWVPQRAVPFMGRGAERSAPAAAREIGRVLDDVKKEAGYH